MGEKKQFYMKGIKKYLVLFLLFSIITEGLALYFPMLLNNITEMIKSDGNLGEILLVGAGVLGFIGLIFVMSYFTEFFGCTYQDKYQQNARQALFEKFHRLTSGQLDQIGMAKLLPAIMNDTTWLKTLNRRQWAFWVVHFPIAIVGSFIMLFVQAGWAYALFTLASIPFVLLVFWLYARRLGKIIPASVNAYDEYFHNVKEGIVGAKDIRIMGKADERSKEFEKWVRLQNNQGLTMDKSHNMSTGFHAILFSLVTIVVVLYGTAVNMELTNIVVLNTAILYINKIWAASHLMFTWFVDYIPRCKFTRERLQKFYDMPEKERKAGITQLPHASGGLFLKDVAYFYQNGTMGLLNVNISVPEGGLVAVAGGIGSGKSLLAQIILQLDKISKGTVQWGEIPIDEVDVMFWRSEIVSFCSNSPRFVSGTVRDNMKLLAPDVSDDQILRAFKSIGAEDFTKSFENVLEFQIADTNLLSETAKNMFNLVRAILKPAQLYVFNQCFEHIKHSYIDKLMALLRKQRRTCVFMAYDPTVCKHCDNVYVMKGGQIGSVGTHAALIKSSADYRNLHSSMEGVMINAQEDAEKIFVPADETLQAVPL